MTGVKQGGVKGRTESTVCQIMNAAKMDPVLILNKDSYWICCMYGFSGLSSILDNSSLVLGNNSSQQCECFSLKIRITLLSLVCLSVLLNSEKRTN